MASQHEVPGFDSQLVQGLSVWSMLYAGVVLVIMALLAVLYFPYCIVFVLHSAICK